MGVSAAACTWLLWTLWTGSPFGSSKRTGYNFFLSFFLEHVCQAASLLHEQNIVFGDLRDPNILYIASKSRAVIVEIVFFPFLFKLSCYKYA